MCRELSFLQNQISVIFLFDLLPKKAQWSWRIGGPHCQGCPWGKCLCVNLSFSIIFPHSSEECTCYSTQLHTCGTKIHSLTYHMLTQQTELQINTQPECDVLKPEWLCEAKVTQSHSFIPIIPCVGWVRGLLMASTLQKGKYCLNMDSRDSHSSAPCIKSIAHSLYNSSTWLIRPWKNPWEKH